MIKNFLFDHNQNFQWASVAACIALLSAIMQVVLQWHNNRKNIDANLKAKSRIEWIQNVRRLSADYIKIAFEYKIFIDPYLKINDEGLWIISENNISKDEKRKINEKWLEFLYTYNLILLYFQDGASQDEFNSISNNEIIKSTENLKNEVENFHRVRCDFKSQFENAINKFRNDMRAYLKGEWDRAKNGK